MMNKLHFEHFEEVVFFPFVVPILAHIRSFPYPFKVMTIWQKNKSDHNNDFKEPLLNNPT